LVANVVLAAVAPIAVILSAGAGVSSSFVR